MSSSRSSAFFVVLIFIAIVLSQYIFVYSDVGYGIVLSLLITLIIYVTISVLKNRSDLTRLAESLALIPLYVLFTSSLPWFFVEQQFLIPMVYSLILGLCFWHMNEYNMGFKDVGIIKKNALKYALLGIVIAIPTGIIEYLILRPAPAFPKFEYIYLFRDVAYMTFFVASGEEILFRGIIMNDLKRIYSWKTALIAQGFLFGIMHMSWRSVPEIGFTFAAGILFGYLYLRTGSLTSSLAMHSMNNVLLVGVLPYLL